MRLDERMMPLSCARHPDRPSIGECVRCGNEVCAECSVEVDNIVYCVLCARPEELRKAKEQEGLIMTGEDERIPGAGAANVLGAICYIPILGTVLALIILVTNMRRNKFMEYHAWQGGAFSVLAPFVTIFIWPLVQALLEIGLGFPPFTWLFWLVGKVLWISLLVLIVWYAYLATLKEYFEVPVILSIVQPFMIYQGEEEAEEAEEPEEPVEAEEEEEMPVEETEETAEAEEGESGEGGDE